MSEWIKNTFDFKSDLYERLYLPDTRETEVQTQFIINFLSLSEADRIIDIFCGSGRHVISLAEKGFIVDGVDMSSSLIAKAQSEALVRLPTMKVKPRFFFCDVSQLRRRHPDLAGSYSAAIIMFSSFGYYENEREQISILEETRKLLKRKGRLLLDLPNKSFVLKNFVSYSNFHLDEMEINVARIYDASSSRIFTRTGVKEKDKESEFHVSMRLYTAEEIEGLIQMTGFKIVQIAGDFSGEKFTKIGEPSKRLLVLAKRL